MISSVDSSIHIPFCMASLRGVSICTQFEGSFPEIYPYLWLYYHSRIGSAFYLIRVKEVVFIWHNISREEVFQSKSVIFK